MYRSIFVIAFVLLTQFLTANSLVDSAETWYQQNQYDKVVEVYEQILEEGQESVEVYYNLGCAYYKLNELPSAILNFEKAMLLEPNDEDILYNLELAKTYTVDNIEEIPGLFFVEWRNDVINIYSSDVWAVISLICLILSLALISVYLYSRNILFRKLGFWFGILILVVSISTFSFSYNQKQKYLNRMEAIVFTPTLTVKSSPVESGTDLFVIHEGTKVGIIQAMGEWIEVRIANGNKGWIKASDVQLI